MCTHARTHAYDGKYYCITQLLASYVITIISYRLRLTAISKVAVSVAFFLQVFIINVNYQCVNLNIHYLKANDVTVTLKNRIELKNSQLFKI